MGNNRRSCGYRWPRNALFAVVAVMLMVFAAACAGDESAGAGGGTGGDTSANAGGGSCDRSQDPIKIGVVLPLSGQLAQGGAYAKAGYDVGARHVNEAGGIEALGNRCVEMVYGDHQADPANAAQAATELVQRDQVVALSGSYTSATGLTASAAADRLGVPYLQTLGSANEITERGLENVFRNKYNVAMNAVFAYDLLDGLVEEHGCNVQRVALLYENSAYGQGGAQAMKAAAAERGYDIVADVSFKTGTPNLSSQLSRVEQADPDAIVAFVYEGDSVVLLKGMRTLGMDIPYISPGGGLLGEAVPNLGETSEGAIAIAGYAPELETPHNDEVAPELRAAAEAPPNDDVSFAYQGVWLLANALEASGSDEPAALRDALTALTVSDGRAMIIPSESGEFAFDEKGQMSGLQQIALQLQGGEFAPVFPEDYATARLDVEPYANC